MAVLILLASAGSGAAEDGRAGPGGGGTGGDDIAYLPGPGAGDVRASGLVGASVHVADDPLLEQVAGLAGNSPVGLLARALPKQKLGTVTDLLLTGEGAVRAVLVDVGRFVGSTGKVVAVPIEAVTLAGDPADPARRILLLAATRDSLQRAPAYEGAGIGAKPLDMTPASGMSAPRSGDRLPLAAAGTGSAAVAGDGYRQAAMSEITPKMLRSVDVYGSGGERIGAIRSVLATDSGIITALVVDMGGMLGFGGKAIALPVHEVTVLRRTDGKGLRVRTSASRAQLQAMPRHGN